jgi:hypothetical protein
MSATRRRIVATLDRQESEAPSLDLVRKILHQRAPSGIEARASAEAICHSLFTSRTHAGHRRTVSLNECRRRNHPSEDAKALARPCE